MATPEDTELDTYFDEKLQGYEGRMKRYFDDKIAVFNDERSAIETTLQRAFDEGKPVDEVFYAMRIDWLQGVYISGTGATFDDSVYDMSVLDTEFDLFTYDLGHGKGHGHTNQSNRGQENQNQGFVIGAGLGERDMRTLQGAPGPRDGTTRRYDRQTLSGNGGRGRNSDYELGMIQAMKDGAFGFDQGASLQVQGSAARPGAAPTRRTRRASPTTRRASPTTRRASPTRRPARRQARPAMRAPQRPAARQAAYDDYSSLPRGGYGYQRGGYSGAY